MLLSKDSDRPLNVGPPKTAVKFSASPGAFYIRKAYHLGAPFTRSRLGWPNFGRQTGGNGTVGRIGNDHDGSDARTGPGGAGLRRGTRLLTQDGALPVECLPEWCMIYDGTAFIAGRVIRAGRAKFIRITCGHGRALEVTAGQMVQTVDRLVAADELKGRSLPYLRPNICLPGSPDCLDPIMGSSGRRYGFDSLARMESLGFFQGDGWIVREKGGELLVVSYSPMKNGVFVASVLKPLFEDLDCKLEDDEASVSPRISDRLWMVGAGAAFVAWAAEIDLPAEGCKARPLPHFAFRSGAPAQAAFLRGLFGANGVAFDDGGPSVTLVSASLPMLADTQLLLQTLGIAAAVMPNKGYHEVPWGEGDFRSGESYRLEITNACDVAAFVRQIGFNCERQQSLIDEDRFSSPGQSHSSSEPLVTKVVHVERFEEKDDAYVFHSSVGDLGLANGILVGAAEAASE